MEPSAGRVLSQDGPEAGFEYLDTFFWEAIKFIESDFFARWMEKEADRSQFGGRTLPLFFRHPGVTRVCRYLNDTHELSGRYQDLLKTHIESLIEEDAEKTIAKACGITALMTILAEETPFDRYADMKLDALVITQMWLDDRCPETSEELKGE